MPRDGKFIDIVGYYNPLAEEELKIDEDKVRQWMERGAKPTHSAARLLRRYSTMLTSGMEAGDEETLKASDEEAFETSESEEAESSEQGPQVEA
jgi:ribosomal protein S16